MSLLQFQAPTQFPTVPMGWYRAQLEDVREFEAPANKFHSAPYPKLEFIWILKDGAGEVVVDEKSGEPVKPRSWCAVPRTFMSKANLYPIADALGLVRDETLIEADTDRWIGRECNISVLEIVEGEGDQIRVKNRIDNYAKIVARPARPKPAAAAAPVAPVKPTPAPTPAPADVPFGEEEEELVF